MKKFRGVFLKNDNELALMREANRIVVSILKAMIAEVAPGQNTMFFEEIAQELCKKNNVKPAFQGYGGFPYALCCSTNEEVVHGFPSYKRKLNDGDIVSFDMGVVVDGFFGDAARTVPVGTVSVEAAKLIRVTEECLNLAVKAARPGRMLVDISRVVQQHAESNGFSIIRRFVGHGIGRALHEKPEIPNFVTNMAAQLPLQAGMVLAVEPMLAAGTWEVDILDDDWTAVTRDGKLSAHFEHSIAITSHGPEILGS